MDIPDLRDVALTLLGIVTSAIGYLYRSLVDDMKALRTDFDDHRVKMAADYATKEELIASQRETTETLKEFRQDVKEGFERIYDKLDNKEDKGKV